jgi:GT2 family glycosyltransferase
VTDLDGAGRPTVVTSREAVVFPRRTGGPPPATLTVVVCSYTLDRWDDLCAALDSLRAQTRRPEQLVLVSDGDDDLLARARAAFPDVLCLPNTATKGLSGARNTGVQAATGDVVAFLDDDAAAAPDWAERILTGYAEPDVMGVCGHVAPAFRAPRPGWFPDEFLWVLGCSYTGLPTARADVRNPIGANMSFLREAFAVAGGFDTAIGRLGADAAGCEETEFSIRARAALPGARVVLEPAAGCRHTVPADRLTRVYFRRRCRAEGRSKALVARLAGAEAALATERTYVVRTLPRAVLRGLRDAVTGDLTGLARAAAVVEGAALTALAYAAARRRG